jgi:ribosomal-protein-alanine N-acetyltransferase
MSLENDLFGPIAWSRDAMVEELESVGQGRIALLAEAEGQVQGYGIVLVVGDVVDVERIAVARDDQRTGVATCLLDAILESSREAGAVVVMLEVAADNVPALTFYAGYGFQEIARRHGYYQDRRTAVVMRLVLSGAPHRG